MCNRQVIKNLRSKIVGKTNRTVFNSQVTGADPESMVTGFIWDLKIFGPRPFPVWATPLFFRKCSSSPGQSLIHQGPWNDLKVERGAKIGRRVKLGSGVVSPEKYSIYASFKSKEMAILEAIVMFILY